MPMLRAAILFLSSAWGGHAALAAAALLALLAQLDGEARTGSRTTIAPELIVRASTARL